MLWSWYMTISQQHQDWNKTLGVQGRKKNKLLCFYNILKSTKRFAIITLIDDQKNLVELDLEGPQN